MNATRLEEMPALILGGCGFIGTNLAHRLCELGRTVHLFDDLSRPGVEKNLRWLLENHGDRVHVQVADVRDREAVERAISKAGCVFHLAAQVAVTTSLDDPALDHEVNTWGTLQVLESLRKSPHRPPLLYASTTKVYGALDDVPVRTVGRRYEPTDEHLREHGVPETRPLDFHTPFGCSKGAADQYVLDYARSYGLDTAVFRMGTVYGPHQFGTEDQGFVAHFLLRALERRPLTLFGTGLQVRDLLWAGDLVEAMLLAMADMRRIRGRAFNLGGGPTRTASLLELLDLVGALQGGMPEFRLDEWRPGDQRWCVADASAFQAATGWRPRVGVREGVARLHAWLREMHAPATAEPEPEPEPAAEGR